MINKCLYLHCVVWSEWTETQSDGCSVCPQGPVSWISVSWVRPAAWLMSPSSMMRYDYGLLIYRMPKVICYFCGLYCFSLILRRIKFSFFVVILKNLKMLQADNETWFSEIILYDSSNLMKQQYFSKHIQISIWKNNSVIIKAVLRIHFSIVLNIHISPKPKQYNWSVAVMSLHQESLILKL